MYLAQDSLGQPLLVGSLVTYAVRHRSYMGIRVGIIDKITSDEYNPVVLQITACDPYDLYGVETKAYKTRLTANHTLVRMQGFPSRILKILIGDEPYDR